MATIKLAAILKLAVAPIARLVTSRLMLKALHGPPQVVHIGSLGQSHVLVRQSEGTHTRMVLQQLLLSVTLFTQQPGVIPLV